MTSFPKKIMLLGSGELGKEVAIAAKRLGCYVIAYNINLSLFSIPFSPHHQSD